jgi:hypothetical protein
MAIPSILRRKLDIIHDATLILIDVFSGLEVMISSPHSSIMSDMLDVDNRIQGSRPTPSTYS